MPTRSSTSLVSRFRASGGSSEGFRRVRAAHALELAEDYVEAIAELIEIHREARVVDLARRLGVSHVTVSRTIQRLKRRGLVEAEPHRSIHLTPSGRVLARRARDRHDLVVAFLVALGVSPGAAEADAEGVEHHVSAETLRAMQQFVNARR
jgi:DtxR family manganese transport transcriptional regulator